MGDDGNKGIIQEMSWQRGSEGKVSGDRNREEQLRKETSLC